MNHLSKITTVILFLSCNIYLNAQTTYTTELNKGIELFNQEHYYDAYLRFNGAKTFAEVGKNGGQMKKAQEWMDKAVEGIQAEKAKSDSLFEVAKAAREKAENALVIAEKMQRKVETAMFDRAVKDRFKNWKGYKNYNWSSDGELEGYTLLNAIDTLDFSENALLRLPAEVLNCPNLKYINLLGNPYINWQETNQSLENMMVKPGISVSVDDIDSISTSYQKYVNGIQILQKGLDEIPSNLFTLKNLVYLDISGDDNLPNSFSILSDELFKLQNLQIINLQYCQIQSFPQKTGELKNLINLNLSGNQIVELPAEIGNLHQLKDLDLSQNQISTIPSEIKTLNKLTSLNLMLNELASLPPEIGFLKQLKSLDLSNNPITELPSQIGGLTDLEYLDLSGTMLEKLPQEIGNLLKLNNLNLSGIENLNLASVFNAFSNYKRPIKITNHEYNVQSENDLLIILPLPANLSSEIGKLKSLKSLAFIGVSDLPHEIGNLINLASLDLSMNQLMSLPIEIGKLTKLTKLDLSENLLVSLPVEMEKLGNLNWLNFTNNQITTLIPEIGKLSLLKFLYLGNNQLKNLPHEIGKLSQLTQLNLSYNQLTALPAEIEQLINLEYLDLSGNQLETLPPGIEKLVKLKYLVLGENNFSDTEKEKIKSWLPNCEITW